MNRVHEQCPKIDSGTVLSQTGSKTGWVHQVHSLLAQPAHPGAHRRAHAWPCRGLQPAVSWPGLRPCRSIGRRIVAECYARLAVSRACLAIHSSLLPLHFQWLQSRYNDCIVTQPASPTKSLAIHSSVL